jgi:Uma2 family endonuclease
VRDAVDSARFDLRYPAQDEVLDFSSVAQANTMGAISEIVEEPLSAEALAERYRALCEDIRYRNLQGKLEIDRWGRITMSPANNFHSMLQSRFSRRLAPLGGEAFVEASILTKLGLTVADVAWASADFMRLHGTESPFSRAPELCIEIASPSNSRKELREKMDAYLEAGATEGWIVFPKAKRFEFYGAAGALQETVFAIDLARLFD